MAEVMAPEPVRRHHRSTSSFNAMRSRITADNVSEVEMLPNPDFTFPMLPQTNTAPTWMSNRSENASKRPLSMHIDNLGSSASRNVAHRRAVSTLPSFTFNAVSATGLTDDSTPPMTPVEPVTTSPTRRGHRRGHSEFVGGDSRLGVVEAVSASPVKTHGLALPIPPAGPSVGRRGHAHRRSAAMSSHDVSSIMSTAEVQPRLSSSLPTTPLEHQYKMGSPCETDSTPLDDEEDIFGPSSESGGMRPCSRPRVGFSDEIEYIPRPLSMASSGTESSPSTLHGHSVNNSISSMLSLGTPSPPTRTTPRHNLSTTFEDVARSTPRSSIDINKRFEKEGEWLKSRSSDQSLGRPFSESAVSSPNLSFAPAPRPHQARDMHKKRHSLGHVLGFDRRRSAPDFSMSANNRAHLSSISLQECTSRAVDVERDDNPRSGKKPSSRKGLAWATSKLLGKSVKPPSGSTQHVSEPTPLASAVNFDSLAITSHPPAVNAETDLDAVFGASSDEYAQTADSPRHLEMGTPTQVQQFKFAAQPRRSSEDLSSSIDLDAALGPFNTPVFGNVRSRRELHSSRGVRDFTIPSGQNQRHFRTTSAPMLQSFHRGRSSSPSKSDMPVFAEEDEEDAISPTTISSQPAFPPHDPGLGVHIVETDMRPLQEDAAHDGWYMQTGSTDSGRSYNPLATVGSRLSTSIFDRRPSSVVEDTIVEEPSPVENIDIVSPEDEPRSSSLTKSSDSSETPTILAAPIDRLAPPDSTVFPSTTSDALLTSTYPSPDLTHRQGSFDTSRLGTSTSSIGDARTMSSFATGEHSQENRLSVDGVPSLTSSRSTMRSTMHANDSHRELGTLEVPAYPLMAGPRDASANLEHRRKRASIASLSQLMGNSFGQRSRNCAGRPQTAIEASTTQTPKKKEHRLKKLMFWKSLNSSKQSLASNT